MKKLIYVAWWLAYPGYGQVLDYRTSDQLLRKLQADTTVYNYQQAATDLSYIGEYARALEVWDQGEKSRFSNPSPRDSLFLLTFQPTNARAYIVERARSEQIILINEAHHIPLHRVFTASLLQDLYQAGFRYFGAETLNHSDSTLNQRKYPVNSTGTYTHEPQYGNLIRLALEMGYWVFPYEVDPQAFTNGREREVQQARNIQKILLKYPKAKILVHAGYAHIQEDSVAGWEKAMAGRLKEYTGIDPFTINQDFWTEKNNPQLENPLFRMIHAPEPSVFVADGKPFAGPPGDRRFDLRVYHPRTQYRHGRPGWLWYGNRRAYAIPPAKQTVGYPCLAFAYRSGEDAEKAIPVDIIELRGKEDRKPLVLPTGKFKVILRDEKGKTDTFVVEMKKVKS